jgi:hypothetical protein
VSEFGQIFIKHKAGKCTEHGPLYDKLFGPIRHQTIHLLEIGVGHGGSLESWCEYFDHPHIFGVDKHAGKVSSMATIFHGDQSDYAFMRKVAKIVGPLHIIIDDGGHSAKCQQESFKALWPNLYKGGVYIIEDLWVARHPRRIEPGYDSTLDFVKRLGLPLEFFECQGSKEDICVIRKL